jgi:DNA-binding MarR family transcriptional regulator
VDEEQSDDLLTAATTVRRGTMRLARRLRLERSDPREPGAELSILGQLNRWGPMTPGALATAERVQPQTLTRTLASLEAKGYVDRRPDTADRRRSLLSIAPAGYDALVNDMRQRDRWCALAMAEHLTPTERGLLRLAAEVMERLADVETSPPVGAGWELPEEDARPGALAAGDR